MREEEIGVEMGRAMEKRRDSHLFSAHRTIRTEKVTNENGQMCTCVSVCEVRRPPYPSSLSRFHSYGNTIPIDVLTFSYHHSVQSSLSIYLTCQRSTSYLVRTGTSSCHYRKRAVKKGIIEILKQEWQSKRHCRSKHCSNNFLLQWQSTTQARFQFRSKQ